MISTKSSIVFVHISQITTSFYFAAKKKEVIFERKTLPFIILAWDQTSRLPSNARNKVISSAYSRSAPTGIP